MAVPTIILMRSAAAGTATTSRRPDSSPGRPDEDGSMCLTQTAGSVATAPARGVGTVEGMDHHEDGAGWVSLDDLHLTLRLRPELPAQVRRLVAMLDDCPAILVERESCVLVDGHMRVAAARVLGRTRLPVTWTSGTQAGLLEQAVIANGRHGVALSTAQRKAAAARLLDSAPGWSNGRIAKACGISEPVVRRLPRPGPSPTGVDSRLGADGKTYPQGRGAQDAARVLLAEHPETPDRAIARAAGLSPTTVGRLRKRASTDGPGPMPDVTTHVSQHKASRRAKTRSRERWRQAAWITALLRRRLHPLRALRAFLRRRPGSSHN